MFAQYPAVVGSTVRVDYGPTPQGTPAASPSKVVQLGNIRTTEGEVEPAAFGTNRPRREHYAVEVKISVSVEGTSKQQTATEAALGIYDQLQAYHRASAAETLGVAGVEWARVTGAVYLDETLIPQGNNATVTCYVHVSARVV